MTAILAGCSTAGQRLQTEAGATIGRAEAAVTLPDLPPGTGEPTPHAELVAGMEARSALARERLQLDVCNADKAGFPIFYEDLRRRLATPAED